MTVAAFNWSEPLPWDGPGAIDGVVEDLAGDRLDRARYAEFLTNYLVAEGKQRNYVLNLNAEWGAGKTWFIKRWYMELKAQYPTVYIDVWQQDFSDDPLLTVISSIIDQLKHVAGKENPIPEGMRQRLLGLFKVGGKLALKAAIKKAGLEEDDFSLEGEDANQLVDALCSHQKERYESIQYLKKEIRQWVAGAVGLSERKLDYPAFILIDELDRCRPSYAVEMLETIKHIFDIPRMVFVLATDTEQLQHAVKVIYGEGFDAQNYLGRFFQRRFTLNTISKRDFIIGELECCSHITPSIKMWPDIMLPDVMVDVITVVCDYFSLSLRQIEQLIDRVIAILVFNLNDDGCIGRVNLFFLIYLFALHEKDHAYYLLVSEGRVERFDIGNKNLKSFDAILNERQDKAIQIYLSPSLVLGKPIGDKWKDGSYYISFISLLNHSYEMILLHTKYAMYKLNHDHEFKNAISSHVSTNPLSHVEAALLARPELSQLEHRFEIYKSFVEMAVHLE
ncbi:KAP family P-loop NTPase fold protein [Aeromonas sanarellii]|uniref:KAP family P-loop NTPase fold protein n=1 Tax=Aeromonas sanarellii TaxID=633415 RepID=UPI003BA2479C